MQVQKLLSPLVALVIVGFAIVPLMPACTSASGAGGDLVDDTGAGETTPVDDGSISATITVDPPSVSLTVPLGGSTTQSYRAYATAAGATTEVTDKCSFILGDPSFGAFLGAKLTAAPRGGTTQVIAHCPGAATDGTSDLTIKLTGVVKSADAPANAPDLFAAAKPSSDASKSPSIEYPLDGAIAPLNLPSIDTQWTKGAGDLFHLQLASKFVAIDYYTKGDDAQLTDGDWRAVSRTAAGDVLAITVEALATATPTDKFTSGKVTVRLSTDVIDDTAIYYWASSTGNLMTQTFGKSDAPSSVHGDCTSCHSVSRAGTRIGYSRCVGGDCGQLFAGFMRFDASTKTWKDTVDANGKKLAGSFSTFSPVGYPFATDDKSLALVTLSGGKLGLFDPDTGAAIASNVEGMSTESGARAALMADWSPDGKSVVFSSTPSPGQWIDLDHGAISTMSYTFDGTNHTFGAPKKIVEGPIALASGSYENLFFPSFSGDGKLVVFNAARAAWRNTDVASSPGQRLMLTDPSGSFKVELANMNGDGDRNVTWPHWAPGTAKDYYWVVFSSERDYGHKLTAKNTAAVCKANGVKQCKQIWIGAIDRTKVSGAADPSAPPMWMPGQDLGADNISPYWTLPATSGAK